MTFLLSFTAVFPTFTFFFWFGGNFTDLLLDPRRREMDFLQINDFFCCGLLISPYFYLFFFLDFGKISPSIRPRICCPARIKLFEIFYRNFLRPSLNDRIKIIFCFRFSSAVVSSPDASPGPKIDDDSVWHTVSSGEIIKFSFEERGILKFHRPYFGEILDFQLPLTFTFFRQTQAQRYAYGETPSNYGRGFRVEAGEASFGRPGWRVFPAYVTG